MSKVTIIIPNYNGADFLGECIESLRYQTYKNFDVLVIDNGSSDDSLEYLRDLESYEKNLNVKVIYLDENLGFAGGVNVGLAASDSKYIILLNTSFWRLCGKTCKCNRKVGEDICSKSAYDKCT